MRQTALRLIERYRIKTPSPEAPIGQFSGGNVQRVVLARQLGGEVDVLIVANPCFGLDFGSRRSPARSRKSLAAEHMLGLPVLVSVSRKSFLRLTTGRKLLDIGAATLAAELCAAMAGASYIRTHDTGALKDALRIFRAVARERDPGP